MILNDTIPTGERELRMRKRTTVCLFFSLFAVALGLRAASVSSNIVTASLSATKPETISVSLNSGGTLTFDLSQTSPVAATGTPNWTTTWNLNPTKHAAVDTCAYFSSTTPLTGTDFGETISNSVILGQPEGSGSYTAITATACGQANALQINAITITNTNRKGGTSTDSVNLEINTTGLNLSPDTYTGTLNIISYAP